MEPLNTVRGSKEMDSIIWDRLSITRNLSHFVRASTVYSKVYEACPNVLGSKYNMARSVRGRDHVDYLIIFLQLLKEKEIQTRGKII